MLIPAFAVDRTETVLLTPARLARSASLAARLGTGYGWTAVVLLEGERVLVRPFAPPSTQST
ncbi:hypothetical protein CLV40_11518 [Actinokineospora auranticolor]|uniref:Uncharacterized protein n=1 Tax=Actinokineospora auranticolor TaxID=155976 RepID=A0A2S6GJ39_9PSEU|nr:hypothetical protein CLV40_11518 [Actinokineospora auranticolor]